MGWYTNYEVEFTDLSDWEDHTVEKALASYNCTFLYLREMAEERVIICLYSHHGIEEVIAVLLALYPGSAKYRRYGEAEWTV